jgi:CDP-diacylglycerol--glycerol-3-phosphate 3-phosphatidyltransferase
MNLPTQLTLLRILLTPVFVFLLFLDSTTSRISALVVFTFASLTDWYDGYAARKYGEISMWGKFLDPLADKIIVSSAFIGFSIIGYVEAWMVLIIVVRDFLITGFRSYAILKGKPITTSFLAKSKTFGQFGVIYFILLFHLFSGGAEADELNGILRAIEESNVILILMYIITFLTVVSGCLYFIENRTQIRKIAIDIYRLFAPSDV